MKTVKQSADQLGETTVNLGIQIDTLYGTHALLEDVLEDFTSASFTIDSEEALRVSRSKMVVLLQLVNYTLRDMDETLNEVIKVKSKLCGSASGEKDGEEMK